MPTLLNPLPLRFLTIDMRCPATTCGWPWSARIALLKRDGEHYYEHLTGEDCPICGAEGQVADVGIDALAAAIDSIEGTT